MTTVEMGDTAIRMERRDISIERERGDNPILMEMRDLAIQM